MKGLWTAGLAFVLAAVPTAVFAHPCVDMAERCRDAQQIIDKAQELKHEFESYHRLESEHARQRSVLLAQAKKLTEKSKKLEAKVSVQSSGVRVDSAAYKAHLADFEQHTKLYNAHLAEYEKQLQAAISAGGKLQASCQQYADHVYEYHVPGVRPPHVCVQLQQSERDMQGYARRFVQDQDRSRQGELKLADQESALKDAVSERSALEAKILRKANIAQIEQTQGAMVLAEFGALAREYNSLAAEAKRLKSK